MSKIPSWVYMLVLVVASVAFIGALAASKKGELNAVEKEMSKMAENLGLDVTKFDADLQREEIAKIVDNDYKEGQKRGVSGTPSIFINGQQYEYAQVATYTQLKTVIDGLLANVPKDQLPLKVETFEDFNCHACASFEPGKVKLMSEYKTDQVVFDSKNYPFLAESSTLYAKAAEAARKQGKFEEFAKALFLKTQKTNYEAAEAQLNN